MSGKLSDDCFAYYVSLGAERSYDAVARHYGVTKRTVARRAAEEDWQGKLKNARVHAGTQAAEAVQVRQAERMRQLREATDEVLTPRRIKAVFAALLKKALEQQDIPAIRVILERAFGKPRSEPMPAVALDLPDGLKSASDVRVASNALLQALADGSLAPEDAQKAATVIEAARKSVETEELETRIRELEEHMKTEGKR